MQEINRVFGCEVVESYGLTEAGANVLTPRWGLKKLGSCGLPVMDVEIRIVDLEDESRDCAPGEIGELWSKGPPNLIGYYKQPDVTAEKMTPDGFVKSGDLVYADAQGYIYFQGRVDDMINCGGENVYPKEVETIILQHPAVADVSVVSATHQVKGEAPVAWVVLHKGENAQRARPQAILLRQWSGIRSPPPRLLPRRNPRLRHKQNRPQMAHRRSRPPHPQRHHRRHGLKHEWHKRHYSRSFPFHELTRL